MRKRLALIQNGPYLSKGLKAAHSGFENQRKRHQSSKTGVQNRQGPKKDICPPKKILGKKVRVLPIRKNMLVLFYCF